MVVVVYRHERMRTKSDSVQLVVSLENAAGISYCMNVVAPKPLIRDWEMSSSSLTIQTPCNSSSRPVRKGVLPALEQL